jgi:hypothetical protein
VYARVRAAVADRRLICIYHHTSFMKAARQDVASLRILSGVVDELTEGVAIAPRRRLLSIDVKAYVANRLGIESSPQYRQVDEDHLDVPGVPSLSEQASPMSC